MPWNFSPKSSHKASLCCISNHLSSFLFSRNSLSRVSVSFLPLLSCNRLLHYMLPRKRPGEGEAVDEDYSKNFIKKLRVGSSTVSQGTNSSGTSSIVVGNSNNSTSRVDRNRRNWPLMIEIREILMRISTASSLQCMGERQCGAYLHLTFLFLECRVLELRLKVASFERARNLGRVGALLIWVQSTRTPRCGTCVQLRNMFVRATTVWCLLLCLSTIRA